MIAPLLALLLVQAPPPAGGVPPEPPVQVASRLRGAELNRFFSSDDYPAAALRAEEGGNVGFRLSIGPNGRIAQCTITSSSGSRALDSATCRILKARVRYGLAGDPRGGRAASLDEGTARWRLPPDRPRPPNVVTYTD